MEKKPFKNSKKGGASNKRGLKNLGFAALLILFVMIGIAAYGQPKKLDEVSISEVVKQATMGNTRP
mgnify:FL=1